MDSLIVSCQQLYRLLVYFNLIGRLTVPLKAKGVDCAIKSQFALAFNGTVNPPIIFSVILLFLGRKYFGIYIATNQICSRELKGLDMLS